MNTFDVVYNERTGVHAVFVTTAAGDIYHTGHAYADESRAWDYLFRCEFHERIARRLATYR